MTTSATAIITGPADLEALVGTTFGPSRWVTVDQRLIDQFSEVSGDRFWIHVEPERAKAGPFGSTIAFGDLTLSIMNGLRQELFEYRGLSMGVNYGWDRVRYPAPLPVDSRIAVTAEILAVEHREDGWLHVVTRLVAMAENGTKPACVADSATRLIFSTSEAVR